MLKIADNLNLPIDFVTERIAFLARTGAGKSGGMRVLFEQMFDNGLFSIFIDPKGDAWGIRAAGKEAGKPVLIIGGDHADIPLEPGSGKYIAEFLIRERVSAVVDISDFGTQAMWTWFADFSTQAYKLNRDVAHLFIDEVDMLAGQQFFDPRCLHGIQLLQNKGRGRGWGITIATQRPQIVNKTVLNASGTVITMQTIGDDALKVTKSLLGQTASKDLITDILKQLPTFQPREAFVYSPQTLGLEPKRIRFADFVTFDSMETPKPGQTRKKPKSVADLDLSKVQKEMSETIERVKADDPATLRKEIAQLKKDLAAKPIAPTETVSVEVPVFPKELLSDLRIIQAQLNETGGIINKLDDFFLDTRVRLNNLLEKANDMQSPTATEILMRATETKDRPRVPMPKVGNIYAKKGETITKTMTSTGKVSGPQQKLLDTLRLFESIGVAEVKRSNLAAFAGVSPRSSGFEKNLSTLRNYGEGMLVEYLPGSVVKLTEIGRSMANESDGSIVTSADLLNAWCRHISNPQGVLLRNLYDVYPDPMTRDDLAACADVSVKSSGYEKNLSVLRSLGLIDYGPNKTVVATSLLFPMGY